MSPSAQRSLMRHSSHCEQTVSICTWRSIRDRSSNRLTLFLSKMDHLSPGQVIAIMVHLDPKDLILMRGVSKIFKQLVDSFLNHYGFECSCCGTNTLSRPKMVPNAKTRATIEKAMLMTAIRSEVFSRLTDEEFIMGKLTCCSRFIMRLRCHSLSSHLNSKYLYLITIVSSLLSPPLSRLHSW